MNKEEFGQEDVGAYALIHVDPAAMQIYERIKKIPRVISCYGSWSGNTYFAEISGEVGETSDEIAKQIRQLEGVKKLELLEIDFKKEEAWRKLNTIPAVSKLA